METKDKVSDRHTSSIREKLLLGRYIERQQEKFREVLTRGTNPHRGKPTVKLLNEDYGDSWRLNDRSFYSRRLGLIREIFQLAEDQRRVGDEEAVAREIEKERQRKGKYLN
jgi:hypothetical protein